MTFEGHNGRRGREGRGGNGTLSARRCRLRVSRPTRKDGAAQLEKKEKPCFYLRRPLGDGFVAQGLQGLHGSIVSGRLAGASLPDELMAPHRQLHEEDLGNRIVVPAARWWEWGRGRGRKREFFH